MPAHDHKPLRLQSKSNRSRWLYSPKTVVPERSWRYTAFESSDCGTKLGATWGFCGELCGCGKIVATDSNPAKFGGRERGHCRPLSFWSSEYCPCSAALQLGHSITVAAWGREGVAASYARRVVLPSIVGETRLAWFRGGDTFGRNGERVSIEWL
jgi:hypothetical protein